MALFKRNPNEAAYVGGKKHIADVIKNSGPGTLLIWRQPEEDFNTNSTLIVMPGEEAIFIKGGTIVQTFSNGTYKLSTENYPFISRLRNAMTGGISTFNCVVYFVRTAHSMEIRWGTDSPIQVRDKMLGIATRIKARGSYKVAISNPELFFTKLLGSGMSYETQEGLTRYFASQFQGKIKSVITKALNRYEAELLGIEERLEEFSQTIEPYLQESLDEYGLRCVRFVVMALDVEEDEQRRRFDKTLMDYNEKVRLSEAEAVGKMNIASADKTVMGILGEDWAKQQAANILGDLAKNPSGGIASAGAGLGLGMAAGGAFGNMTEQMFSAQGKGQTQQGAQGSSSSEPRQESGRSDDGKVDVAGDDPLETLSKLKKMLDAGLIEQADYDTKKDEVLSRM